MDITFRDAILDDIPFLTETIIEAEKSGTDVFSYTTIFGLSESDAAKYISLMLEEEIDGCELSVSSFLVAELDGETVGAVCAWIESKDGMPSTLLKGNLLRYIIPRKNFEKAFALSALISELHIEIIPHTIQIGLVYVSAKARGKGVVNLLLGKKIKRLQSLDPTLKIVGIQVFDNNLPAIKAYQKFGFEVSEHKISSNEEILKYLPSGGKLQMNFLIN